MKKKCKDLFIWLYLFGFKVFFNIFNILPVKNRYTFIISFGDNCDYIYEELRKRNENSEIVFLYKNSCSLNMDKYKDIRKIKFETANIISTIQSIYYLATSKFVIVDNYFAFLSCVDFKKEVECIQVWHAVGAYKKFGLEDRTITNRSEGDRKRFIEVYKRFHKVVVGSESMAEIFVKAFKLPEENILRSGVPRTDFFFDEERKQKVIQQLHDNNLELKNKKIILYAPTYRDGQLHSFDLNIDLNLLYKELGEEYVLILRLHPAVKNHLDIDASYKGFIYDYSSYKDVNELLLITDILITDYSSIPFEYAILNRPIIFYAYDLLEYEQERGLWYKYKETIPGPVAYQTSDIINQVKTNSFDFELIKQFAQNWNEYSNGNSSENLVNYLQNVETEKAVKMVITK